VEEVAEPINVEAGVHSRIVQLLNKADQVPMAVAAAAIIFVAVYAA
jgi:hypothetical protein